MANDLANCQDISSKKYYLCTIMQRKINTTTLYGLIVLTIAVALSLPWLGLGHFYTRGEPREALVAVEMMSQDNYILPDVQGQIPYKPPMLQWLVVLFSAVQGYVSEFTARIPSAVASIFMTVAFFFFYARRTSAKQSLFASLILMTCFEVHRASMTCRVDMVLMAFTVGAIMAMQKWSEKGCKGWPILASLLASGAILTKGPIGIILPSFILFVYMLIIGERFGKVIVSIIKLSLPSLILPALWYIAAYHQAGDEFLNLVIEENFSRFSGSMPYESHEHNAFYTIPLFLSGLLPFTLFLVFGLFTIKYNKVEASKPWIKAKWDAFRQMDKLRLFAIVAAVCIFVFFCIPKSKRSVYLLPMYPFVAIALAEYLLMLYEKHKKIISSYAAILSLLAIIFSTGLIALQFIDASSLGDSRSAQRMAMQLTEYQIMSADNRLWVCLFAILPGVAGIYYFAGKQPWIKWFGVFAPWCLMTLTLDAVINPALKNCVPDYEFAQSTKKIIGSNKLYFYCMSDPREEDIFTVNFYMDDNRFVRFEELSTLPDEGYLIVREGNLEKLHKLFADGDLQEELKTPNTFTSFRGNMYIYKFEK